MLRTNEGTADGSIRVAIGPDTDLAGLRAAVGAARRVGLVPLITGAVGFCPIYRLLGISTCPLG